MGGTTGGPKNMPEVQVDMDMNSIHDGDTGIALPGVGGIAKPWGPTEILSQRAISSGRMKAPHTDSGSRVDPGDQAGATTPRPPFSLLADAFARAGENSASTIPAQAQPARPKPPAIPDYRKDVFANRPRNEWRDQHEAFLRIPGVTDTESRAYMNFALQSAGGHKAFTAVGAPEAAMALGDTLFRHGRTGGSEIIQRALDKTIPGGFTGKGPIGPHAFPVIKKTAADPNTRQAFLDALAEERKEAAVLEEMRRNKVDPQTAVNAVRGEFARFDHFRFQKASHKSP
ncbi:MAG: hypothetical protein COW30_03840 [Rhodospirillales bacterium CG15_BIG_FIL_POST_REV_8_21_14_020_66_15]|nr:MAG: hypothetical protein COW30_03840 [Rhodospirillales bacterium CG15_BIG_FIL_POST_REV_8_21_14_020_66_15]